MIIFFSPTNRPPLNSVCSDFQSTCLVSECLLWRCLFSPKSTGLCHDSLSVPLHQPSSCHLHSRQSADDCDNKRVDDCDNNRVDDCDINRVDNSSSDEHNDVDDRNCSWHGNCDDNCSDHDGNDSELNDVDERNCCWRNNCYDKCAIVFHADDL